MAAYMPLYEPAVAQPVDSVDFSLRRARQVLAEQQPANIHNDKAVLRAAVHLEIALRSLVASLDAEGRTS